MKQALIESLKAGAYIWFTVLIYLPVNLVCWGRWEWFEMKYGQLQVWAHS